MTDDPAGVPPATPAPTPPAGPQGSPAPTGANDGRRPRGDELPEELDITLARPYQVPDNSKRKIAAACYVVAAAACAAGTAVSGNGGLLAAAVFLALAAAYHLAAAWPLKLDETSALAASAAAAGFPVGHASAQLAWRGLRSRPVWRVLLYSADEPPSKRGLVELDAVDGEILGSYTEDNPEDWSAYGFSSAGPPPAGPAPS
ncbi:MAG TPA: hypothetical protein VEN99_10630 [Acidimicrobiia bacterium]|nr:hypothetical protein [Acidimicrobiia bacterium]